MAVTTASDDKHRHHGLRPGLPFPPEIRNTIYRLVLVDSSSPQEWKRTLVQPDLTRVSSQTRAEALPLYYGTNRFKLDIPLIGCHGREDTWYRYIRRLRVFAAGGAGRPGTSWLRFIRRIWIVYSEVKAVEAPQRLMGFGMELLDERFELGFRCGHQESWEGDLLRGKGRRGKTTDDHFELFLPFLPRRNEDRSGWVENDCLDWKNKNAVQARLHRVLKGSCIRHRAEGPRQQHPRSACGGCAVHDCAGVSRGDAQGGGMSRVAQPSTLIKA